MIVVFHGLVLALSLAALAAYVCRLNLLSVRVHRWHFVALHIALSGACAVAAVDAWERTTDLQDVCALGAALLWLAVSWPTWRNGVPRHVESDAMPLEDHHGL